MLAKCTSGYTVYTERDNVWAASVTLARTTRQYIQMSALFPGRADGGTEGPELGAGTPGE